MLGEVIPAKALLQWVKEEAGGFRERIYSPLSTLVLFIEQVLSADHSCTDAVARGLSARAALGQTPCSLNSGPYCKARAPAGGFSGTAGARGGGAVVRGSAARVALAWARGETG